MKCIHDLYERSYAVAAPDDPSKNCDPFVPIDIPAVAARLHCKPEMLLGRLYCHLDAKHRYKQENGTMVRLFWLTIGSERHCVHFPYLAALLAEHQLEHRRQLLSVWLSIAALVISLASIISQVLEAL